ncbi:inorganic pyrophosphatase 1-like [Amaranthus tricolor]|uniref:inorganic pyrophosphatase 1-like n=1 Tax=Amaranthus tricolor TaxID=29722 RepID=UPI00258450C5|nr:inorganic pyrophosphatase 1-like [Amaranthus tricolor]
MGSQAPMENIMVVFDFDKTIVDVDTDNWVLDQLGFTDMFNQLLPTMPWNPLMDKMMKEMHEKGVSVKEIIEVLKRTPMHDRIIPAIKSAYDAGCDLRILSDANRFFIETILDHHGIKDYFTEIHTNTGYVDEVGRVRIFPHHDYTTTPHGCPNQLCPPNMCKGVVMEKLLANEGDMTFIYLGDGNGDHCPSTKLRENDYCMPRKSYPLWGVILSNPKLIHANIHGWTDGEDLENVLLAIVHGLISKKHEKKSLARSDFKLKDMPRPSREVLSQALPVSL